MISGIPSSGGYFPSSLASSPTARPASASRPAPATVAETRAEPEPAELQAPQGDEETLSRELNLFDLANRQFSGILPRLELATSPVE